MSHQHGEADAYAESGVAKEAEPHLRPVSSQTPTHARTVVETPASAGPSAELDNTSLPQGFVLEEGSIEELLPRITRLEKRLRLQWFALIIALSAASYLAFDKFFIEDVLIRKTVMESEEITLLDNNGTARLFIRMYSKVPVLQIMDSGGIPRMSMGLRFDDTPFIDLSDKNGRTRATLEMTDDDSPALRMFDADGRSTFNIN